MYSGTTLHGKSGNLVGAHQKFDRVCYRYVKQLRPNAAFPNITEILHFEGNNGPDGIKRKSPGNDEPWHFWNPADKTDTELLDYIDQHYYSLVRALQANELERSAFEAAWLAHAIVDGLTPAHHYDYSEKLTALRGESLETRNSFKNKMVIKGETRRQTVSKNWRMWGPKGLIISHGTFEWGVSSLVLPLRLTSSAPKEADLKHARNIGFHEYLRETALAIDSKRMYQRFLTRGWSTGLAADIRKELCPRIAHAVGTAWLLALDEATS